MFSGTASLRFCRTLGLLSILALAVAHLALTDIARGEGDLTAEWTALRVAALVILASQVTTLWTLRRLTSSWR